MAYDGTRYAGFQVQPNAPTVQAELERALSAICDERVRVTGAGRTDAGVHASGQVIDFRTASALDGETIERGVNALLPKDIAIADVEAASDRRVAGPSAPANGLCLIAVEYGQDAANAASEEGLQGIPPLREEDE